jgi:hypothetical protein
MRHCERVDESNMLFLGWNEKSGAFLIAALPLGSGDPGLVEFMVCCEQAAFCQSGIRAD